MDLAVKGGHVYTGDGGVVEADVGIDNGRIREVGDVGDADRTVDATGSLVLPGLVNAHTHSAMTLLRGYADDLPLDTWLEEEIWPVEAHLTADDVRAGARLAVAEMLKGGTTAFGDMYFHMDEVAEIVGKTGIRASLGYGIITVAKDDDEARDELEEGLDFVRERDGGADGRLSAMVCPHAPYTCDDETLRRAAEGARSEGVVAHTHLSETEEEVDDCVEDNGARPPGYLDGLGFFDGPAYVAHGVHLDQDDIDLLSSRDAAVAHCPSANMKLASGAAPVRDMLDAGITVGIGTDGPASNNTLDMLKETRHAALVAKLRDGDASAVPAETALRMATRGGAEALGLRTGVLEEGRPADLAVVDTTEPHLTPGHDLVSHAVYAANAADVGATVVDGEVLYEDGELLRMDEEAVVSEAEETARDLVERTEAGGGTDA